MTPEGLVSEHLKEKVDPSCLYDEVKSSVPEVIQRLVALLKSLCVLGNLIPLPVVLIKAIQEDGRGPYLQNLIFPEVGDLHVQCLTIQVSGTLQLLRECQQHCRFSEAESALYVAVHELRHCLQTRRKVEAYRGTGWLGSWARHNCPDLRDALIAYASAQLQSSCKHAAATLPMGKSKKGRQHGAMLECDADVTAIACVTLARLHPSNTLGQVARLLHG